MENSPNFVMLLVAADATEYNDVCVCVCVCVCVVVSVATTVM